MFLQHTQVELHHVPADDDVGIMLGKPGVEFFQQLRAAGDIHKLEVQLAVIAIRRAQHINGTLAAAFQTNAIQFAVSRGFDIQRDPF